MKTKIPKFMYVPLEFRMELDNIMKVEDLHSKSEAFRKAAKYAVIGRETVSKEKQRKKSIWFDERF